MVTIEVGAIVAGKSGTRLKVVAIDAEGDPVVLKPNGEQLAVRRSAIIEVLEPLFPAQVFPIGTKIKLTVAIDKKIDNQTGKVVAILGPTLRRVRWQLWTEKIERNFQLSYLREVAV
jgi:hypothetical protein